MKKLTPLGRSRLLYSLIIFGGILLDQLTKLLTVLYLKPVGSVPLWQGVLHLTYVENRGAAFGILTEHRWVFMVFSTLAILGLGFYLMQGRSYLDDQRADGTRPLIPPVFGIGLALIVSGGIGNMLDRLYLGYVVDFIDFALIDFAVFNGADSFVTVGCGMLLGYMLYVTVQDMRRKKADHSGE